MSLRPPAPHRGRSRSRSRSASPSTPPPPSSPSPSPSPFRRFVESLSTRPPPPAPALAAAPVKLPVQMGWLLMQQGRGTKRRERTWTRRFFALREPALLSFFETRNRQLPLGNLNVHEAVVRVSDARFYRYCGVDDGQGQVLDASRVLASSNKQREVEGDSHRRYRKQRVRFVFEVTPKHDNPRRQTLTLAAPGALDRTFWLRSLIRAGAKYVEPPEPAQREADGKPVFARPVRTSAEQDPVLLLRRAVDVLFAGVFLTLLVGALFMRR